MRRACTTVGLLGLVVKLALPRLRSQKVHWLFRFASSIVPCSLGTFKSDAKTVSLEPNWLSALLFVAFRQFGQGAGTLRLKRPLL